MQYALVNGIRSHAKKGLEGLCELCNSKVIAKCGDSVIHHWSHYKRKDCDKWWEPETLWHRDWKNKFPEEYREIIFKNDSTMEIHRADIYTPAGLTIEFQHSFISNEERTSRENFYNKLIWVVDGSRRANDFKRFQKKSHYLTTFYKDKKDFNTFTTYWDNNNDEVGKMASRQHWEEKHPLKLFERYIAKSITNFNEMNKDKEHLDPWDEVDSRQYWTLIYIALREYQEALKEWKMKVSY